MIDKRKENLSKAFSASLSFGFTEKEADYSLNKEDTVITKYAGLNIYQPTVENTELFIRKYVLNELAFFPKALDVSINLIPSQFDSSKREYIKDASGVVKVKLHNKTIEFPFIVRDGELVPFDVIQMDNQRVPYSRENLRKVIIGLDRLITKNKNGEGPFVGLEKAVNPLTSPGFLGDVINIRDQHIRRKGNDIYVTASNKIDEALEKVATIKPLTQESIKLLESQLKKVAMQSLRSEFKKLAEEAKNLDLTDKEARLFQKIKDIQFVDANTLPNGTIITFPEKDGKDIVMTKAIVLSNFIKVNEGYEPKIKVVLSVDGRMRILNNSERFLCFKATDKTFSIAQKSISELNKNDIFIAFDGNKTLIPSRISMIKERYFNDETAVKEVKVYGVVSISDIEELISVFSGGAAELESPAGGINYYNIAMLEGTKFQKIPYSEYIARKSKESGIDKLNLSSIVAKFDVCLLKRSDSKISSSHDLVFATSPDTKVIVVKGVIKDFFRDKSEFEHLERIAQLDMDFEEGFEKFAVAPNEIRIECLDRYLKLYKVNIKYVDKTKKIFKQMENKFDKVGQEDLIAILRILNFEPMKIKEILFKAKNEPSVVYPLPQNSDASKLNIGNLTNITMKNISNTVNRIVNPQKLIDAIISHAVASMITSGLKAGGGPALDNVVNALNKFASESKALSSAFEKVAMERKSKYALDVAKLMSLNALFVDKIAKTITEEEIYPRLGEVADDIRAGKDHLERIAKELIALKTEQYDKRNEIINPNYIQSAVNQIDNLYKLANSVSEAYAIEKEAKFGFGNKKQNFNAKRMKDGLEMLIEEDIEEMSKEAGIIQGLKTFGKTTARTLGGAAIGAAIGIDKTKKQNVQNPDIDEDTATTNTAVGAVAGGIVGGALAGIGGHYVEKNTSLFKNAGMNVPTEEEAKKESNIEPQNADDKDKIVTQTEDNSTRNTPSDEPHLKESTKSKDLDEEV